MRIIAGEARGRKLFAPNGEETRPTSDKVRESLFNIIGFRIRDARVLDLFGGTGAMALEALSRGAVYAVICDVSRDALRAIERNAEAVLKEEKDERVRILRSDYRTAISSVRGERFDFVFLDPPYRMLESYSDAITRLDQANAITEDCLFVLEHRREDTIRIPDGFESIDRRDYGITSVQFVRKKNGGSEEE